MILLAAFAMAATALQPLLPVPSPRQAAWQKMERYCFCHFGPNTFTGEEWGKGNENPEIFNPKHLDCLQWCRVFKKAGFTGVMITAKHHDGFCLWPSKFSKHTIAQSPWRNGKGDILRELSDACHKEGLKFGVYLSPWDRNHPTYGTPQYNDTFKSMLREVLTHYGPVFEVWFDGANGEGPNGKRQVYDWPGFVQVVRECQPKAVIFSDGGPDIRWVGNENGYAGETNWAMIDRSKFSPGHADQAILNSGDEKGTDWVPAECDVSLRPGWFWRASEDTKVKSVRDLLDIWYGSVGRGSNLILNVPPNSDGLISDVDANRLVEFDKALKSDFSHPIPVAHVSEQLLSANQDKFPQIAGPGKEHEPGYLIDGKPETYWWSTFEPHGSRLVFDLGRDRLIDRVELSEPTWLGQRIKSFELRVGSNLIRGTTVGYRRILRFAPSIASHVELTILGTRDKAVGVPAIAALNEVRFFGPQG